MAEARNLAQDARNLLQDARNLAQDARNLSQDARNLAYLLPNQTWIMIFLLFNWQIFPIILLVDFLVGTTRPMANLT